MNLLLQRMKRSFFSFPLSFWSREYMISLIIFTIITAYNIHNMEKLVAITILTTVNAFLFPFSKFLIRNINNWWYEYVHNVNPNTIVKSVGLLSLVIKAIKNIILFSCSFILGIFGITLLLLIAPKSDFDDKNKKM